MRTTHLLLWPALATLLLTGTPSGAQMEPVFQQRSEEWVGSLTGSQGHAECRIEMQGMRNCKIFLDASGLAPNASYSLWYNPDHESLIPLGYAMPPMRTDKHGTMHASSLLNGAPPDRQVQVVLRQEREGGQGLDALSGTLKRQ